MSEDAYGTTAQEEELDSLLGSHAGKQNGSSDEWDMDAPFTPDTSQVTIREKWPPGTYLVRSTTKNSKVSDSGSKMVIVTFTCEAGPLKGKTRNETMMMEGRGLGKTCVFLSAVGLYNSSTNEFKWKSPSDVLDKVCWIVVEHSKQTSKRGTEFIGDSIPWDGFYSLKDASGKPRFDIPADNDPFAEPGQVEAPTPVAAPKAAVPASVATSPIVSASAEPAPNWT